MPTSRQMPRSCAGSYTIEINEKTGNISLTDEGEKIALRVFERHHIITQVLVSLGVSLETAKEDACKIEHDLSDETFNALKDYYKSKANL